MAARPQQIRSTSSSTGLTELSTDTSTTASTSFSFTSKIDPVDTVIVNPVDTAIVNAVYTHIQAVRALGRDTIDIAEIARALRLSQRVVDQAVARLKDRGVRRVG